MKVLMLGWEFPPFFAGGVGVVCYELTKAFSKRNDIQVTYVMPYGPKNLYSKHVRLLAADNLIPNSKINIKKIPSLLSAYMGPEDYNMSLRQLQLSHKEGEENFEKDNTFKLYGSNLIQEVYRFAEKLKLLASYEDFDVIHAHDWTTFPAAIALKELTGKPFVVHVHITEFNKSGGQGVNPQIYAIEKEGMQKADAVIVVSNLIKNICIEKYGINPNKIKVIHNANVEMNNNLKHNSEIKKYHKIVLFAGRVTLQKGPDYFVEAAKKVCEYRDDVKFVMAGSGDMLNRIIDRVVQLGIADKFIFHGFYNREDAEKFFSMADVFVMPSVSEPFGVVPLEAMMKKTPTIVSKQSGVSEVLNHTLKVDFWDIDEMANKILALLNYSPLHSELSERGYDEARSLTWDVPAQKCIDVYNSVLPLVVNARQ
ncbi:MAG: glycosyl transferase [Candidatus Woesearchaeota archaeon]|nr:MAG: glycosyl transferase [Candidatus Woesearchaeota archaeon]